MDKSSSWRVGGALRAEYSRLHPRRRRSAPAHNRRPCLFFHHDVHILYLHNHFPRRSFVTPPLHSNQKRSTPARQSQGASCCPEPLTLDSVSVSTQGHENAFCLTCLKNSFSGRKKPKICATTTSALRIIHAPNQTHLLPAINRHAHVIFLKMDPKSSPKCLQIA